MALKAKDAVLPVAHALQAFSPQSRVLVVAPHPDDETIATGLLIQQIRAAGGAVRILLLTAGDNNPWPQRWLERRWRIGAADRQRWGRRRYGELLEALRGLGLDESDLQFMGWPDMGLTGQLMRAAPESLLAIAGAIDAFRPDLMLAPALSDHHPDHGSAHVLVRLAMAGAAVPPRLLTYLVHGVADDGEAIEIDGDPVQRTAKRAALEAHRSQMALSGGRMRGFASRPERYASLSAPLPRLPWQPPRWLQPWLRLSVVSAAGTASWRWAAAPLRRDEDGMWRLTLSAPGPGPVFVRLASSLPMPWIFDHWGWCELR